ncbi:T9SS type A sorting domain-containing protein [Chitinophaga nivalis]|uniref:T9SS type A sorting domain-containing protein n=1 Tax=Chitinophaga nivalis TaxID=2991709 RepID=A0ABT3IJM0_9BACT|nr:T9SS type A sorting domain-containing protein [Chitinophaga nivalis]MCW3466166.1 T9SS type A sorting domain-containing protein [Chitinophaga nivalis]MCW3484143.1 T9SS type A sorting domain-containing protein [Chitinophaga nivalis]
MTSSLHYGHRLWVALLVCILLLIPSFGAIAVAQIKIYANGESHQIFGVCVGCQVLDAGNTVGSNENDYATFTIGLGVAGGIQQTLHFPRPVGPGKVEIGLGTGQPSLLVRLLGGIAVETLLGNIPNGDLKSIDASLLTLWQDSSRGAISFPATKPYDAVRIYQHSGLAGINVGLRVYYAAQLPMNCGQAPANPLYYFPFERTLHDAMTGLEMVGTDYLVYGDGICGEAVRSASIRVDSVASTDVADSVKATPKTISFWARLDLISPDEPDGRSPLVGIRAFMVSMFLTEARFRITGTTSDREVLAENEVFRNQLAKEGEFNQYVFTYDDEGCALFVNGAEIGRGGWGDVVREPLSNIQFFIHQAQLDDLIFYSRALTAEEVKSMWCSYGKDPACQPNSAAARIDTAKVQPGAQRLTIYPNPSTGQITIGGDIPVEGSDLWVKDMRGQEMFYTRLRTRTVVLPSSLPEGMYLVTIRTKDRKVFTRNLVLTR